MNRRLQWLACSWSALACLSCAAPKDGEQPEWLSQHLIHGQVSWVSPPGGDDSVQRSAQLEVALLRAADFLRDGDTWLREDADSIGEQHLLCAAEPLANETSLAFCSGVAVAADVVVTAAHCLRDAHCDSLLVTTAFDVPSMLSIEAAEVVGCTRVLMVDDVEDVAVIQLNLRLPGDFTCSLRRDPLSTVEPGVAVSHPLGASTKIDLEAMLSPDPVRRGAVRVGADAFTGSSGGGVFDQYGKLVALLTRGLPDLTRDERADCMRLRHYAGPPSERTGNPVPALEAACALLDDTHPICGLVDSLSSPGATLVDDVSAAETDLSDIQSDVDADRGTSSAPVDASAAESDPASGSIGRASCRFTGLNHRNAWAVVIVAAVLALRRRQSKRLS